MMHSGRIPKRIVSHNSKWWTKNDLTNSPSPRWPKRLHWLATSIPQNWWNMLGWSPSKLRMFQLLYLNWCFCNETPWDSAFTKLQGGSTSEYELWVDFRMQRLQKPQSTWAVGCGKPVSQWTDSFSKAQFASGELDFQTILILHLH